jgi:RNA polymerase sigma factor (TIGR02999 family)
MDEVARTDDQRSITTLLVAWGDGDLHARERLLPRVYQELRRSAAAYLRHERANHSLEPAALVHETYLRLIGQHDVAWQNRAHFFGVASQMMRRILVDYARARHAERRNAALTVALDDGMPAADIRGDPANFDLLMLNDALDALALRDRRQAQIVELRYFGGLTEREVADSLSLSRATVTREWQVARAWLFRRLTRGRSERNT